MKQLYKYKSLSTVQDVSRFADIILTHKIYLPTRTELNDPLEGAALPLLNYAVMGQWYYGAQHKVHAITEERLNQYRILSLSADGKNLQLWAHYAGNYTGACIEFAANKTFSSAKPVDYIESRPEGSFEDPAIEFVDQLVKESYFKKSFGWQYEHEYRLIVSLDNPFLSFDRDEITAVHLGHNINPHVRDYIVEICRNQQIPVYSTWYGDADYTLHLVDVDAVIQQVYNDGTDILDFGKGRTFN